jgi:hypothetical protein
MPAAGSGPAPTPPIPRYGESSLSDLMPSLLSAIGLPGLANPLAIEPLVGLCVLVIDGLGWTLIQGAREHAPFLSSLAAGETIGGSGRAITAGFPSTTSASLGSLGTGLPPGEHGLVGYTFAVPGHDRPMNTLLWELYGVGDHVDLRDELPPEVLQPRQTLIERADQAGLPMTVIGPPDHANSPLTRAILRGGRYEGAHSLADLVLVTSAALDAATARGTSHREAVYAYHPLLDTAGHIKGVGSPEWLAYLADVDRAVEAIAAHVPGGFGMVVTGDHGMVNLVDEQRLDVSEFPELLAGVRSLAGEARARHVYARSGAERDILAVWRDLLGDRMWVVPRAQAVDEGWFGPTVSDAARGRIGDVVAAAFGPVGVFQKSVDPLQAMLIGHHGSMTPAEQLVPLLMLRR